MRTIVSFSGGKDSQAALIQAVNTYGAEHVEAVFCDTGWEHPLTYKHVTDVCTALGVKLTTLRNSKVDFSTMCIRQHCFPVATRRICTAMLKIQPMIDWVLEQDDHLRIIQGIRACESASRAKMDAECAYFKEYFDNMKGVKLYRKRAVLDWCKTHDASLFRPIFSWSAQEVIDYILANGQRPNPLYERGASRVGCFPCIMSRLGDIRVVADDVEMRDRLVNLEHKVNETTKVKPASFFTKGTIPERCCRTYGDGCPTAEEVFAYVKRNDAQMDMFAPEEGYSCMSLYHGLCE